MANFSSPHDIYFPLPGLTQSTSVTSATGTSTTPFSGQTRAVQVLVGGAVSSTAIAFVKFYNVGQTSQASSTTDTPVPLNWVQYYKVNPGMRASVITGDATAAAAYTVYFSEMTD